MGLKGCSPFLGFDRCHLKGSFEGVLLAVIGLDGNNGLFPIVFVVLESDCKESWAFSLRISQGWWEVSLLTSHGHLCLTDRSTRSGILAFRSKCYPYYSPAPDIKRMCGKPKKSRRKEPGSKQWKGFRPSLSFIPANQKVEEIARLILTTATILTSWSNISTAKFLGRDRNLPQRETRSKNKNDDKESN
ncbi:hypothetical protein Sango_2730600 [Sesamum angolense]|uniref:Uncharacterized protein n=1 Tax=Sesamum angolense TaxID=2727404 RepID=A0AAE1VUL5_9LAMI|nr:hypothetical protein Sango_2730600 [Sesamum angolense]